MLIRSLLLTVVSLVLFSCRPDAKPEPVDKVEAPKPSDESSRFPSPNLVDTKVVNDHLLDKQFMPGGTLAHYKKGKLEYDMFLAKLPTPTDAAIILPDWRRALTDFKPVPSFGGLFGMDGTRPVFVFTKNTWILGIAGLNQKDADREARTLATRVN